MPPPKHKSKQTAAAPPPPAGSVTTLEPERAIALPSAFAVFLIGMSWLPPIAINQTLAWSFRGAGLALLALAALLYTSVRSRRRVLKLEISLRKQHWVQACAHTSILLYWGWYWRTVYDSALLIAGQLVFAYAFDALLAWSRRDTFTLGFGPFPIIFSTNLFLWFKPDWFYLQFVMVAVGFTAKEMIRWKKEGRLTHIFNPSSFTLALFSLGLLVTGTTSMTWGPDIATSQFNPPYIFWWIFACALPGQFLFGVAAMTFSAVATTFAFCFAYFHITGSQFFIEQPIPIAIFLGMHLLFTDPSTAPRTELGRIVFGMLYGMSVILLFVLLDAFGMPTFYDKLLPVPILNLTIRAIDRVARSDFFKRFDPGLLGRNLAPRMRNAVYMTVWATVFFTIQFITGSKETMARADILLAQNRVDEAIVRYQQFTEVEPGDSAGYTKLGAALLQGARPDEALTALRKAVELQPGNAEAQSALGVALIQHNQFDESVVVLRRTVELNPRNAEAHRNLGTALMQLGHLDDAVAALQRSAELEPNEFEAFNALGMALMQQGNGEDAVAKLQHAVMLQPDSPEAQSNLGVVQMKTGRIADAVASFRRAAELQPDRPENFNMLGMALLQQGRGDEAVAPLRRAVEMSPDYPDGRLNLGNALTAVGQAGAAVEQFRLAMRARPDWPPALGALAWLEATADIQSLRNPAEAVQLATQAADSTNRQDPQALDVLAAAYAASGRFADAIRTAEAAKALVPPTVPALGAQIDAHLAEFRSGRPLILATH